MTEQEKTALLQELAAYVRDNSDTVKGIKGACRFLHMGTDAVRRAIKEKRLGYYLHGGEYRFSVSDHLRPFLRQGEVKAKEGKSARIRQA